MLAGLMVGCSANSDPTLEEALATPDASRPERDMVSFGLFGEGGETIGIVQATMVSGGIFIEAEITGLEPGSYAMHIHATGSCHFPFSSAGGHFNPTGVGHGRDNPRGAHVGDLPNIQVPESRLLTVSAVAVGATLRPGLDESLADEDGSALVIHAGPDDYRSDPGGDSGPQIACGVIFPPA